MFHFVALLRGLSLGKKDCVTPQRTSTLESNSDTVTLVPEVSCFLLRKRSSGTGVVLSKKISKNYFEIYFVFRQVPFRQEPQPAEIPCTSS